MSQNMHHSTDEAECIDTNFKGKVVDSSSGLRYNRSHHDPAKYTEHQFLVGGAQYGDLLLRVDDLQFSNPGEGHPIRVRPNGQVLVLSWRIIRHFFHNNIDIS